MKIKAQKIPQSNKQETGEDILARFCYHFTQYTYADAQKMPYSRIIKMLKVARKEQAYEWYNLLKIIIAPHGKKGTVAETAKELKQIIEN